jgi:hypothetical protein
MAWTPIWMVVGLDSGLDFGLGGAGVRLYWNVFCLGFGKSSEGEGVGQP